MPEEMDEFLAHLTEPTTPLDRYTTTYHSSNIMRCRYWG